jgi:hypothetical protein
VRKFLALIFPEGYHIIILRIEEERGDRQCPDAPSYSFC